MFQVYIAVSVVSSAAGAFLMHISTTYQRKPTIGEQVEKLNQEHEKIRQRHQNFVDNMLPKLETLTKNPLLKSHERTKALLDTVKLSLDEVDGMISCGGVYSCSQADLEKAVKKIAQNLQELNANTVERTTAAIIEINGLMKDPESRKILLGGDYYDDTTGEAAPISVTLKAPSFMMAS